MTGSHGDKLLEVSSLERGTSIGQAQVILKALTDWNLKNLVKGMHFDTCNINTGTISLKFHYLFFSTLVQLFLSNYYK